MSDVTPINPSAGLPDEDPFESHLDAESDEDFGYVVTRDRATGPDGHPVKLADWSAQDFASIYTRFRPHLERHARRFLNNQSQVDEVVQDAFLYLMVSLPELDSEIGVLRFLKWKTRLLCLDVIRASGKAYVANLDDVAEPISADPEVSSYLEQQDDAAVLRLALSKLNPRHREVLLASIYEEKSATEIAAQVGLSENATRQLIFRARSAFKKALLGDDVNTDGMSAAAILSVAARKAANEAKKVGAQAMVFVLFMMLAIGAFVNFSGRGIQTQQLAESQAPAPSETRTPAAAESSESVQVSPTKPNEAAQPEQGLIVSTVSNFKPAASPSASPFAPWSADDILDDSVGTAEVFVAARVNKGIFRAQNYTVASSSGAAADLTFDADAANPFSNVSLVFTIEGVQYTAKPKSTDWVVTTDADGLDRYTFTGVVGEITDVSGITWANTQLSQSKVRIEMVVDPIAGALAKSYLLITKSE